MKDHHFTLVLTLGLVLLLYFPMGEFGFTNWDDPWLVQQNHLLATWTPGTFGKIFFDLSPVTRGTLGNEYLPVLDSLYAMQIRAFGAGEPFFFHWVSLITYMASLILVYFLLVSLFHDPIASTAGTLLFALHPTHVENVAWIAEQKSLFGLFFFMLGFTFLWERVRKQHSNALWRASLILLSLLCFVASVASKSTYIVYFPLVLLWGLYVKWPSTDRRHHWALWATMAFLTMAQLFLAMYVGREIQMFREWMGGSLSSHIRTLPLIFSKYLWLLLFPWKIQTVTEIRPIQSIFDVRFFGSLTGVGLYIYFLFATWKRKNWVRFIGLAWFAISLLPVLQIAPIPNRFAARYLLLPSLALPIVWLSLHGKWKWALGIVWMFGFSIQTVQVLPRWKNCQTLWEEAVTHSDYPKLVHGNLFECYQQRNERVKMLKEAQLGVELFHNDPRFYVNLGLALLTAKQTEKAETVFAQAFKLGGSKVDYLNNVGVVRMYQKKYAAADRLFEEVLSLDPHQSIAWANRGSIALTNRNLKRAAFFYRRSIYEGGKSSKARQKLKEIYDLQGTNPKIEDLHEF